MRSEADITMIQKAAVHNQIKSPEPAPETSDTPEELKQ